MIRVNSRRVMCIESHVNPASHFMERTGTRPSFPSRPYTCGLLALTNKEAERTYLHGPSSLFYLLERKAKISSSQGVMLSRFI